MDYNSYNPFTGELINSYKYDTDSILQKKIEIAEAAYKEWSRSAVERRIDQFKILKNTLDKNINQYAYEITLSMGKPMTQSLAEVEKCGRLVQYYIDNSLLAFENKYYDVGENSGMRLIQPVGGVLGIMPWNFPFWQVMRFALPALMAGNVVLLKHAPNCFLSGESLSQLFLEAEFMAGTFTNLIIDVPQVKGIIENSFVQGVALTGSVGAGKSVAATAGGQIKRSVMELGGNDPLIVFDDADLDSAVENAYLSRFSNNGQVCIAAKRIFVQEKIYDAFKESFLERLKKEEIKNPFDDNAFFTCIARTDLTENLKKQVNDLNKTQNLIHEGSFEENKMMPFVFEMNDWSAVRDVEIFGPVACIGKFKEKEDVIKLCNDTPFGLAASLFTKDEAIKEYCIEYLNFGNITINEMTKSHPELPFGGTKLSGYGKELSTESILEFTNRKAVYPI